MWIHRNVTTIKLSCVIQTYIKNIQEIIIRIYHQMEAIKLWKKSYMCNKSTTNYSTLCCMYVPIYRMLTRKHVILSYEINICIFQLCGGGKKIKINKWNSQTPVQIHTDIIIKIKRERTSSICSILRTYNECWSENLFLNMKIDRRLIFHASYSIFLFLWRIHIHYWFGMQINIRRRK